MNLFTFATIIFILSIIILFIAGYLAIKRYYDNYIHSSKIKKVMHYEDTFLGGISADLPRIHYLVNIGNTKKTDNIGSGNISKIKIKSITTEKSSATPQKNSTDENVSYFDWEAELQKIDATI